MYLLFHLLLSMYSAYLNWKSPMCQTLFYVLRIQTITITISTFNKYFFILDIILSLLSNLILMYYDKPDYYSNFRKRIWDPKSYNNLHVVTQPIKDRTRIQIHVWARLSLFPHLKCDHTPSLQFTCIVLLGFQREYPVTFPSVLVWKTKYMVTLLTAYSFTWSLLKVERVQLCPEVF